MRIATRTIKNLHEVLNNYRAQKLVIKLYLMAII
jgi:hypothetical protein